MDNNEIAQQVIDFITKTGTAMIQAGFAMSVRYVIASAITQISVGVLSFGVALVAMRNLLKIFRGIDNRTIDGDSNEVNFKIALCIALTDVFTAIALISNPVGGIKMLIAPEWYSILNIIDLVK